MLTPRRLSAVAAATAAAALVAAGSAAAHQQQFRHHFVHGPAGAVFVQTDNLAGNKIAVYDRNWNGTLSPAGIYGTGGNGGQETGSVVDHEASQDSLKYDAAAHELFAVNAGSNTVSVFSVFGDHLQLRQVINSGGTFPVSIAIHDDLVYVLNAENGGAIAGYSLSFGGELSAIHGSGRALGLNPAETPQFTSTPGDIAFTPNGNDLLVTTKNGSNAIDVFSVNWQGLPATNPVVNTETGDVPFSIAFEPNGQVAVGEAGPNAVETFNLHGNGTLSEINSVLTGGAATCWLVADGPWLFAGNAGSATENTLFTNPFGAATLTGSATTDGGTVDATTSPDGHYLYVQTGAAGIVDEFSIGWNGALTEVGSVTVPQAVGGEGIATS
jgi:hypothetical protein